MKKRLLPILFAFSIVFAKTAVAQSWVDLMQDPTVNFYDVQKAFNKKYHKQEEEKQHEVYDAFLKKQKAEAKATKAAAKAGITAPVKGQVETTAAAEKEDEAEIPGWEIYKRWEDFMKPRVGPSGDRMTMVNAMNEYYEKFYNDAPSGPGKSMGSGAAAVGAANWSIIGPTTTIPAGGGAGRVNFVRFDPVTVSTMWVGSPGGGLWKTTNSGASWTTNTDQLAVIGCSDVAINPSNNAIMYLAIGDGDAGDTYSTGVLKSTNGGGTWAPTGLNWAVTLGRTIRRIMINPTNPNTLFAGTSNGVYRTYNAGATWTQIATAVANIKDIEYRPGDTTTVYATSTTTFYKSTNGGTSFVTTATGLPATALVDRLAIAVTAANANYVYVLASLASNDGFQGLYRSTDNGATFTTRATTPNLLGWSNVGSDTGGQGWYDLSIAVAPTNANLVIVGGVNIWKSTDGGSTWTINAHWTGSGAPYVHADCHALEFIPGSATTYYAGCDGGFFGTSNTGAAWTDYSNGLQIGQPYRLGLSATNANLLVTGFQDNGTNRWSGTSTWSYIQGGDGMEAAVDWSNANVQYGELYYGQINRTITGGNLTTSIVASGGAGVNANGDWVTPYILNPQKASTMIVGKAQAYRSRNRGTAWNALGTVSGGTGNLIALAYAPSDSLKIYMAKVDKFYASTDGGATFTDRTTGLPVASAYITYIAVASNNPLHVWVTFSGFSAANKVWYSADGGVTWSNYSTGLPNLPTNCIVYQNGSSNDALYVGTDVGVYYRDNVSASWAAYNTGLPNVIVKELEIQYTAVKLRAATFGRGIWQSDLYNPGAALPIADFSANRTNICVGDCINFTDLTTGSPTSWSWSFPGAATTTSTVQNPSGICYNTAGTYNVTLTATNINGSNAITKTAYITVSAPIALPLVEGFQATFIPPNWQLINPDGDLTWAQTASCGGFGGSTQSAVMDNLTPATSTAGYLDEMITPKYNFSAVATATMTFDVAYARYSAVYTDSLRVFVSTDCGTTWNAVYNKGGFTGLQTAPDNSTTTFVPTAAQWRTETVSMTPYAGQANVMVKFQNRSGWGQMMYLDNINISSAAAPVASVVIAQTAGTNPECAGASATFTATPTNGGATPSYQWQVNGANVGVNSPTYTTTTLTTGQIVTCIMTSSMSPVSGSPATSNSITMTVTPIPATPTASNTGPYCAGTTINLSTPTVAGATYSWTGPSAYSSALQNPTRPGATVAMAGTYSVTETVGGCTSLAGTTIVVVNPIPTTPTAGSNTPVCVGLPINLTTPTVAGATYSWTGPSAFSSALQNPSTAGATAGMAGTYSVTITVSGCTSAVGTTAVVVNPTPTAPTAGSNTPVCTGSTINLTTPTVAGATYNWTGPNAFSSSVQNPSTGASVPAMAGTYSVTITTGGCTSAAGTTTVVVNTTPATPTASNTGPYCAGSTISLSTPTVAGSTYSWTGPSAYSSAVQNPTRPASTVAMSGTYSVTITVSGCTSPAGTTAVVVNPTPATPTAGSNSPVCVGSTLNLTTPTVAGATYAWTGPSAYSSAVQNPTRPGATAAMAGTYSVTVTSGGCTSAMGTTTVVVNPIPATPTAGSNSPVCVGSAINLTTPTVAGSTYAWTGPLAYSSATQNPSIAGATAAMAGTYSVTVTTGGCTSVAGTTAVVVNPTPATPTAGSNTPVCVGSTILLTTPTVAGATYAWTGPAAYSSAVQNPSRPAATLAMGGTYSVTVTTGGCTSAAGTTAVVITSPVAPAVSIAITSGTNPTCSGQSVGFTATPTNGGTTPSYQWQVNGVNVGVNSPLYTTTTLNNGDVVTCIMTSNGTCVSPTTGTSAGITMTVNTTLVPAVSIAITTGTNPTCAGTNITFTATPTNGGVTPFYQWQVNGGNVGTNSTTYSSSTLTTGQIVTCTMTSSSSCASPGNATSTGITMTVNPIPATPTASSSSPVCSGTTLSLSTPTVAGATYAWSGPPAYVSALQNPTRPAVTLAMAGTYSVTVTNSGCTSAAGTTVVVVNSSVTPTITIAASPSGAICSGTSVTFTATITNGGTTPTYQWKVNGINVGTSSPTYTSAALNNGDIVKCTLTSNATCASPASVTSATITMTVNPSSVASVVITGAPTTICSGDSATFTATPTNGGVTPSYQWHVNGTNVGTNSPSFISTSLNNGDVVTCTMTTSLLCASPAAALSNSVTMVVNPTPAIPTITIAGSVLTSSSATGNQWYFNGSIIAGATNQTYTFSANGNYTVVVTSGSCSATSAVMNITTTGIADSNNPNMLSVYPNPNDGNFMISFQSQNRASYKVRINNALGQIVYEETIIDFSGTYSKPMSVVEFGNGVYTISLTNSKNETVKKIIVY